MDTFFSLQTPTKIPVDVYSTHYRITAGKRGELCNGLFDILPVINRLRIPQFNGHGEYVGSIRYYRYIGGRFYLPIYTLSMLTFRLNNICQSDKLFSYEIVKHDPNPTCHVSGLVMQSSWVDRPEHAAAIAHLMDDKDKPLRGNDLQTGKGKTYVSTKVSTLLGHPTLVICESLVEQWVQNYLEKTCLKEDQIFVIQGIESILQLIDIAVNHKDKRPAVIIGSLRTVANYADGTDNAYRDIMSINELMTLLEVGTCIHDEIHLSTHAHVLIDLVMNIKNTLVLSATPKRSDKPQQAIFVKVFPKGIIGGANEYDKYVNTRIVPYHLNTHRSEKKFTNFGYGYSHVKYESVIIQSPDLCSQFFKFLDRSVQAEYANRASSSNDKCLIFVSTVRMAKWLKDKLESKYRVFGFDVRTYLHEDPIDNLMDADIIISTPKSCGVGKDIPKLITVINTVSMASEPGLEQMFGRLRKLEGKELRFIDMVNNTVQSHARHLAVKKDVYKKRSKEFEIGDV